MKIPKREGATFKRESGLLFESKSKVWKMKMGDGGVHNGYKTNEFIVVYYTETDEDLGSDEESGKDWDELEEEARRGE